MRDTVKMTKAELRQIVFNEILNEAIGDFVGDVIGGAGDIADDVGDWIEDNVTDPVRDAIEDNVIDPVRDKICDVTDDTLRDWRRDLERWIKRNADDIAAVCPYGTEWACEKAVTQAADEIAECIIAAIRPDMCR